MTKQYRTNNNTIDVLQGYFVELKCTVCERKETFAAKTKAELITKMNNSNWIYHYNSHIDVGGNHCGCKENNI